MNNAEEILTEKVWVSFHLIFSTMQWGPQSRRERDFQEPTARTRICSGSARLQSWAQAKTRWSLPGSLYRRTVPPSVDHGILICVPWKRVLLQTHLGSTQWRRFNEVMPSILKAVWWLRALAGFGISQTWVLNAPVSLSFFCLWWLGRHPPTPSGLTFPHF